MSMEDQKNPYKEPYELPPMIEEEDEEFDLFAFDKRLLITTIRKKIVHIFVISVSFFIIFAVIAKTLIKNQWEGRAVLMRHKKNMALQGDVPYLYEDLDFNTILETIKLKKNLQHVIDKLDLETTTERLFRQINVTKGRHSNIMQIISTDTDPETACAISNELADYFVKSFIPIQNSSAEKIHAYYLAQRKDVAAKLKKTEAKAEKFKKHKQLISIENETSMKFNQLKELELSAIETEMNIVDIKTKIKDTAEKLGGLPENVITASTIKNTLESQIKSLELKLTQMLEKYTEANPKILKIRDKIKQLKKRLASGEKQKFVADEITYGKNALKEKLDMDVLSMNSELKSSRQKIDDYKKKIDEVKKSLSYLTRSEQEYYEIKRKIDLYRDLLKTIENRIVEAKIAMESNISDFEVLEYASPPQFPLSARRKIIAIVGGMLGLFFSLLFFAGREYLDTTMKSPYDFDQHLKQKMLGNLPDKDQVTDELFFAQFQIFFNTINELGRDKKPAFITFGSDINEVGKTFIIKEVIRFLNSQNKKVLHVETVDTFDREIENDYINDYLYSKPTQMSELETNKISELYHKMYFLADKTILRTAVEKEKLENIRNEFADYDFILWELFEIGYNIQLIADIVQNADLMVMIAAYRESRLASFKKIKEFMNEKDIYHIGGVLNRVEKDYLQLNF